MSSSSRTPDRWVVLKLNNGSDILYKVLAGWSGSYLEGQSWRINSGITSVENDGEYYRFYGESGSVYLCHKKAYGMNGIMCTIYNDLDSQAKKRDNISIEILPDNYDFMSIGDNSNE